MSATRAKFLLALEGKNPGRPPFWFMRQAGRYLPEYLALRKKWSFELLCKNPELLCEVTLMPLNRFSFDAAIVFSDILLVLESMGQSLRFEEKKGPILSPTIDGHEDLSLLHAPIKPQFLIEGIALLKKSLSIPLIGFSAAPFTLASYAIEGGSSPSLQKTRQFLEKDPTAFSILLDKVIEGLSLFLKVQIESGVEALQLFDSWALFLTESEYRQFALPATKKLLEKIATSLPIIHFARGSAHLLPALTELPVSALSIDMSLPMKEARKRVPRGFSLQGNLHPEILLGPKETLIQETQNLLSDMQGDPGYIFNLGHGILPNTPLENVYAIQDLFLKQPL